MGNYLNPGNRGFQECINEDIYVDKTGLIAYTNSRLSKRKKYICVSRPRRFGKSYAADMLTAYYDCGCDSRALFNGLDISKSPDYETHINRYDVVYLDASSFFEESHREGFSTVLQILNRLKELLTHELMTEYPEVQRGEEPFTDYLSNVFKSSDTPFVFIIDEWDAVFRIFKNDVEGQTEYLGFLNTLFKQKKYVALAYMTGILPIKKYGTNSALNMFEEYTMLDPGPVKEFIGFTEDDVKKLCVDSNLTEKDIKDWYDGYTLDGLDIYNSNSVVKALNEGKLDNYWTKTEAFDDLLSYIKVNVDGLHDDLLSIFANENYVLDVRTTFPGDLVNLKYKEDYIIALIHLGYLAYDSVHKTVTIPNYEVRIQFEDAVSKMGPSIVATYYDYTKKLLDETLSMNAKGVATMLGKLFSEFTRRIDYKEEDDFGNFVYNSYMVAEDYYDVVREAPTRWLKRADYLFYPNLLKARAGETYLPGVIIELKNQKSAKEAADQIEGKGYDDYFEKRSYHGDVIHVGLDFKKVTPEERQALASQEVSSEDGVSVGNDANLNEQSKIVHFCEIRKYTI
ncbi:MAG: AAA family ATPase [Clostridia bacterium]|nr:AAA family ATPase [Clostridia bacterium]